MTFLKFFFKGQFAKQAIVVVAKLKFTLFLTFANHGMKHARTLNQGKKFLMLIYIFLDF